MSLWIWTDPGHCLHRGAGHLPLADRGLSGQVPPVCQIHSGLIMIRQDNDNDNDDDDDDNDPLRSQ